MEETSVEKTKTKRLLSNRCKCGIIISGSVFVVAAMALVFVQLNFHSASSGASPTNLQSDVKKEVDVVSLAGFHVGRMVVTGNNTEGPRKAIIDYHLQCKDKVHLNESLLLCEFTQIGCTMVMQDNITEKECIMEDIMFSFAVDEDGNIFTNGTDVDLLDPARLAMALYTKHLRARDYTGGEQQLSVNKTNSTHACIHLKGLFLEVTELPLNTSFSKHNHQTKRRKRSNQSSAFFEKHLKHQSVRRRRRSPILDSVLAGAFGQSLRNSFKSNPYIKVPDILSKSGSKWGVRYDFRLSNLEVFFSTLPDIHLTAIVPPITSVYQDGYQVKLKVDFSLNHQCNNVVASRIHVYFRARACIWFWCFVNVRKDDHVSLTMTPALEITLTLKPKGNTLQYSFALTELNMAGGSDIGTIDVSLNIFASFGAVGFIVDRILESIAKGMYHDLEGQVPGMINREASHYIRNLLPQPGVLDGAGVALVAAHMGKGVYNSASIKLLTLDLSKIGGLLAKVPALFQPNKIPCSGQGLIQRIHDDCVRDYGASASGDSLEIYCYGGAKRFCLSGELCPWRNQRSAACSALFELATCSVGGLGGKDMAYVWGVDRHCNQHCSGWWFWRRCYLSCHCSGSSYGDIDCVKGSVQLS